MILLKNARYYYYFIQLLRNLSAKFSCASFSKSYQEFFNFMFVFPLFVRKTIHITYIASVIKLGFLYTIENIYNVNNSLFSFNSINS